MLVGARSRCGTPGAPAEDEFVLPEACGKTGRTAEGLAVLAEALAWVDNTGERWAEAELYRLKGELTLQQCKVQSPKSKVSIPHPAFRFGLDLPLAMQLEAEGYFQQALAIARRQSAKSWELRAVMSLSRLWQQQGRKDAARQMLAEIYGWFTEGFDTRDLQEAKALLIELT